MIALVNKRKRIFSSYVFRYLFFYILYLVLFLTFFSSLTSIVVFFHFLLEHRFVTIEDWIYRHAWEMIIFTKIVAGYIVFRFMNLKIEQSNSFINFIKQDFGWWPRQVFVSLIFLFLMVIWVGQPRELEVFSSTPFYPVFSYVGSVIFYLVDYFILAFLRYLYPMKRKRERTAILFSFPIIFYLFSVITLPFAENLNVFVWLHLLSAFFILEVGKNGWFLAFCYFALLVAPLSAIFGMDPIWGSRFSPYNFSFEIKPVYAVAIWSVSLLYLWKYRASVRTRPGSSSLTQTV